jgi:hypothetical protein
MKFLVSIVLFTFITFLSTPTLVGMIDDKVDTSYFYNMCEEEENLVSFNEIKSLPSKNISFLHIDFEDLESFRIFSNKNISFFNLAHQIFSPPPNFI